MRLIPVVVLAAAAAVSFARLDQGGDPASATSPGFNGRIVFDDLVPGGETDIFSINPDGTNRMQLTTDPANDFGAKWSPDGGRIVFTSERDGNRELYVMMADGSAQTRITSDSGQDFRPTWHPNGTLIAYRDNDDIYTIEPDGDNATPLIERPDTQSDPAYSPEGDRIAFSSKEDGDFEIWVSDADGSDAVQLTRNAAAVDSTPSWSPDGKKIAFGRFESGNSQVFVMNANGSGETMITTGDAYSYAPVWSPDGTLLVYGREPVGGDGRVSMMDPAGGNIQDVTIGYDPDWQRLGGLTQGNLDCDDDVDSVDALLVLRHVASLAVNQPQGCPAIGADVASLFGDTDCDEDVDSVDALKILRHVAALPVSQVEPCPDIGRPL